jgi:hypothetical protein
MSYAPSRVRPAELARTDVRGSKTQASLTSQAADATSMLRKLAKLSPQVRPHDADGRPAPRTPRREQLSFRVPGGCRTARHVHDRHTQEE